MPAKRRSTRSRGSTRATKKSRKAAVEEVKAEQEEVSNAAQSSNAANESEDSVAAALPSGEKLVYIEACKAFKTRADKLQKTLKKLDDSIVVYGHSRSGFKPDRQLEDPAKPAKGVFKVSVVKDGDVVTVLACGPEPRPFRKLKNLDIDDVASSVVGALA